MHTSPPMQHDQTYERERKNLIEEEVDERMSEDEPEKESFSDADGGDNDEVSVADDAPDG